MTHWRRAALVFAALLAASCTHRPAPADSNADWIPGYHWAKTGASGDQFEHDLTACESAASEMDGKALPEEAVQRINRCLEAKGYHLVAGK